jgi:hypothetical protein
LLRIGFETAQRSQGGQNMTANVGGIDRILRIVAGIVLIALVFVGPQTPWGWIGIIPLATGLLGWCPVYVPFGISSCPRKGGGNA